MARHSPWEQLKKIQEELPSNFIEINQIDWDWPEIKKTHARATYDQLITHLIKYLRIHTKIKKNKNIEEFLEMSHAQFSRHVNQRGKIIDKKNSMAGFSLDSALIKARRQFGDHFRNTEFSDQTRVELGITALMEHAHERWFGNDPILGYSLTVDCLKAFVELHNSNLISLGPWLAVEEDIWFGRASKLQFFRNTSNENIASYTKAWVKPFMVVATIGKPLIEFISPP